LVLLYLYAYWYGVRLIARVQGAWLQSLLFLMVHLFALSAIINMGVVLGMLPTKGLTLPFMSYGGSSLIATSILFGILIRAELELDQKITC
ncbi:MAG: FtsW/RodA/SpoVE family cell cycle protein, partial [Bdellovibrionaceae bacterium]|nr:FtsW/RodA/SpoVE family cell cycle protein [Pseudobdellovibrionaceae bacterium]MDW8190483.1 FtsW/RodA/SpoVE family cell cycle protein [Pseudobdellovibrionaceae bacterium]